MVSGVRCRPVSTDAVGPAWVSVAGVVGSWACAQLLTIRGPQPTVEGRQVVLSRARAQVRAFPVDAAGTVDVACGGEGSDQ